MGETHVRAILTEEQVRFIRQSTLSNAELGRRFGVDPSTISNVRSRKHWKQVD